LAFTKIADSRLAMFWFQTDDLLTNQFIGAYFALFTREETILNFTWRACSADVVNTYKSRWTPPIKTYFKTVIMNTSFSFFTRSMSYTYWNRGTNVMAQGIGLNTAMPRQFA
jgi:hypothetical protein